MWFWKKKKWTSFLNIFVSGQGCQVPPDSHWEQDPQAGPLLQDQESTGPQLEVVSICSALELCSVKLSYCWVSVIDPRTITDVLWKAQFIVLLCLIVGAAIFLLCYKNAGGKLAERLLCATSASPLHTVRLHLNISLLLHTTYLCCIPLKKNTTLGL